jgi:RND superfamily putative drug exporter
VRVSAWSARHRWWVAAGWFLAVAAIFAAGAALGTRIDRATTNVGPAKLEAARAQMAFDAAGGAAASESLTVIVTHPTLRATDPRFKAVVDRVAGRLEGLTYPEDGTVRPVFSRVANPYGAPLSQGLFAPDGSGARVVATLDGEENTRLRKLAPVRPVLDEVKRQPDGFAVHYYNNTLFDEEINELVQHELDSSLRITLPLTFLILLLAFGAIGAAVVPLVLALTSLLAAFGILAIYSQTVSPVDINASQVIVLIGLAVGIDYSLFLITRYRTERRAGRDKNAAIAVASSTAGRAVFFSGLTVMISLAGLFLVGDNVFASVAAGTIGVVLVAVIGSLTFVPAVLAILGRGVDWGRLPYFGRERAEGQGAWAALVGRVMGRPVVFSALVMVVLLALAYPVLHMRMGNNGLEGFPDTLEGTRALKVLGEKWPQGTTLTMSVVVTGADRAETKAAIEAFKAAALEIPGLSGPVGTTAAASGTAVRLTFFMAGNLNSPENWEIVRRVRQEVVPAHFPPGSGAEALVTGRAAFAMDFVRYYLDAMPLVFGFVLGLSFLLLLIAFHSLVIPLKAILLNLLSTGAAYGAMVLVFQDGWFSGPLGFVPTGVIQSFIPVFMFTILFGLSMDYHLFILTRIKEARDRGEDSRLAVARGIAITSGTITSAAAIMVAVFAVFVTLRVMIIKQLGLGLAVAVLIDATIIRSILLPATMQLLGDWNWWLPPFLRWLPRVTIEGETEGEGAAPEARPEPVGVG